MEMANKNPTHSNNPYSIPGLPPLPFDENDTASERGERIWAVIEHGRQNEDPRVDRVFQDEASARHHAARIRDEEYLPATVHETQLE